MLLILASCSHGYRTVAFRECVSILFSSGIENLQTQTRKTTTRTTNKHRLTGQSQNHQDHRYLPTQAAHLIGIMSSYCQLFNVPALEQDANRPELKVRGKNTLFSVSFEKENST